MRHGGLGMAIPRGLSARLLTQAKHLGQALLAPTRGLHDMCVIDQEKKPAFIKFLLKIKQRYKN